MIPASSASQPRRPSHPSDVIVVVEDDPAVRSSLRFSLEAEGYAVVLFPDAGSLLAEASLPARGCLVIDYYLPDGNGLDALRVLRGRGVVLPAILVTTDPSPELRSSALSDRVAILEKPLFGNALTEEIGAALARIA